MMWSRPTYFEAQMDLCAKSLRYLKPRDLKNLIGRVGFGLIAQIVHPLRALVYLTVYQRKVFIYAVSGFLGWFRC